jgi:hypothetical protein
MRGLLLIWRTVVFLLALAGGVSSGFLGMRWREAVRRDQPDPAVHRVQEEVASQLSQLGLGDTQTWAPAEQTPQEKTRCSRVYPFLLVGLLLGAEGGLLVFRGRYRSGAALLLVAGLGPAVLHPASLIFTSGLLLAGVLALGLTLLPSRTRPWPDGAVLMGPDR